MLRPSYLVLSMFLVSPWCAADIFQCTKGGQTVYQNFPCPIDSIGSQATQPPPAPEPVTPRSPDEGKGKPRVVTSPDKEATSDAEPRVGMTTDEVRATWGEPMDIIKTGGDLDIEGRAEVWRYSDERTIVLNNKGRVSTVIRPQPEGDAAPTPNKP